MEEIHCRRIVADEASLCRHVDLLGVTFPNAKAKYTLPYLTWQYIENPDGSVLGYDAFDGDTLVAHYATQPIVADLDGRRVRGLLSYNTATHSKYQGRGLFTRLARATYEAAFGEGYEFVVGVANQNSTPGFVKKLGFQLVAPLDARVGVGGFSFDEADRVSFERVWSPQSAAWRVKNPNAAYKRVHQVLAAKGGVPGVRMIVSRRTIWSEMCEQSSLFAIAHPLSAWIGLEPSRRRRGVSIAIPQALRPSPLNLIYRNLIDSKSSLDPLSTRFEGVDFDAY